MPFIVEENAENNFCFNRCVGKISGYLKYCLSRIIYEIFEKTKPLFCFIIVHKFYWSILKIFIKFVPNLM